VKYLLRSQKPRVLRDPRRNGFCWLPEAHRCDGTQVLHARLGVPVYLLPNIASASTVSLCFRFDIGKHGIESSTIPDPFTKRSDSRWDRNAEEGTYEGRQKRLHRMILHDEATHVIGVYAGIAGGSCAGHARLEHHRRPASADLRRPELIPPTRKPALRRFQR